jgi:hypothetical protein
LTLQAATRFLCVSSLLLCHASWVRVGGGVFSIGLVQAWAFYSVALGSWIANATGIASILVPPDGWRSSLLPLGLDPPASCRCFSMVRTPRPSGAASFMREPGSGLTSFTVYAWANHLKPVFLICATRCPGYLHISQSHFIVGERFMIACTTLQSKGGIQ